MSYTQKSIWNQINLKALYSPIHFYISMGGHEWKTDYPYLLAKATLLDSIGKQARKHSQSFIVDSLDMDISPNELVKLQKKYNVDIFISKDVFQDSNETTKLTTEYLRELIKEKVFDKEIMIILQGVSNAEYIDHLETMLIITANAEQCINCKFNLYCDAIFWQSKSKSYTKYCEEHYEKSKKERKWLFRFAIGGLIKRKTEDQKEIIESILNFVINSSAFTFKDIYPERIREIMVDTIKGFTKKISYDPVQFHIFGIGASKKIFPTIMRNQPYIMSLDTQTPSKIALYPQFFDKELGRFPSTKQVEGENKYSFKQKIDDVGDVSALNTLRTYYNVAMILFAMESKMKIVEDNEEINIIKRCIKYPKPKLSKLKQTELEAFLQRDVKLVLINTYEEKKKAGLSDEQIIDDALKRWTKMYEETGYMPVSLALLNGLIIFKRLSIKDVIANMPTIKSPTAAMNVLTIEYKIMQYPICEDTQEYKEKKTLKTIQIRKEHLDLVLKYLLKDPNLVEDYKKVKNF